MNQQSDDNDVFCIKEKGKKIPWETIRDEMICVYNQNGIEKVTSYDDCGISELNWEGAPVTLESLCIKNNCISELNWKNAPKNLKSINLINNNISKMNWEDAPESLEEINLECNKITEMNWKNSPKNLRWIDLSHNKITEMNWENAPKKLEYIYLCFNNITSEGISWKNSPKTLIKINLCNNLINEMIWNNLTDSLEFINLQGIDKIDFKNAPRMLRDIYVNRNFNITNIYNLRNIKNTYPSFLKRLIREYNNKPISIREMMKPYRDVHDELIGKSMAPINPNDKKVFKLKIFKENYFTWLNEAKDLFRE